MAFTKINVQPLIRTPNRWDGAWATVTDAFTFRRRHNVIMFFLPPELYRLIIQNVHTRADLHRLLFVSRTVSYEAESALYRNIRLQPNHVRISMQLFSHLAHCTRVARYVRELVIDAIRIVDVKPSQYWDSVNQALCALTRLLVLEFFTGTPLASRWHYLPSDIFSNCTFKLEVLKLDNYFGGKFPPIDLTQVKELSLMYSYGPGNSYSLAFRPDAFLSLRVLTSSISQFDKLGTRNTNQVRALDVRSTLHVSETFASITSLKIHLNPIFFGIMAFPSLRYLCYWMADTKTIGAGLSNLLGTLADLKNLEKFAHVLHHACSEYPPDLHIRYFAAINSLQELVLSCGKQDGRLWSRNGSEPIEVPKTTIMDEWKHPRWF